MKNINNNYRFLIFFSVFFLTFSSVSQTVPKGYEIVYKSFGKNEPYLYLTGIYGDKLWIADSAKFSKNQYVFKNSKKVLPSGFYTIQSIEGDEYHRFIHAEFIVDQTRNFSIENIEHRLIFTNSEENIVFRQFKDALLAEEDLHVFYETAHESLLGKFVSAQYIPVNVPEFFWGSGNREAAAQKYYQYLIDHYYDPVDFKDIRLMYTPLNIDLKDFFMKSLFPQTADNVIRCIEKFFQRMVDDEEPTQQQWDVRDFYLKKLIHLYMNADPKFDEVFVYLADNYVSKLAESEFISDSEKNVFQRMAERKRKTLVGQTVPAFESYTSEHHKISTSEITSKYTILWFWDPDCEHCVEETPKLCEFYSKYHELYNFEVIACSITEDYDRWKAFISKHHVEWFNTSYAIEQPNYDAEEFFNFNETPAIYIIDKQHTIIARQFPLDELIEVFESLQN